MIGSPTDYVAEWKFGSVTNTTKKNERRAEQEQRSAHGCAVNKQVVAEANSTVMN